MSMRKFLAVAAPAAVFALASPAFAQQSPNLGKPISAEDLAAWDISVGPDGAGLPPGSGTVKQGEAVFAAKCQACHGEKGAGTPNDRLVGIRQGRQGRGVGGRWQELGSSGAAGAGAPKGRHPLPHGMAMGRRPGDTAEPFDRRDRVRPAEPRATHRVARRPRHLPQQHDPVVGRRR